MATRKSQKSEEFCVLSRAMVYACSRATTTARGATATAAAEEEEAAAEAEEVGSTPILGAEAKGSAARIRPRCGRRASGTNDRA